MEQNGANKKIRRLLILMSLGIAYGFMFVLPYMKSTFYDQMIAAMEVNNEQLGSLMSIYAIACTVSYLPGGWIADRFKPKTVLLFSTFGNAILCFIFMMTYKNFFMVRMIWLLCAFTGGFAFWPAIMKGIRLLGDEEEQGRMFGIFEGMNGVASLLVSFIMVGLLSLFSGDLITGFKGAVGSMGVLCLISGVLILILFNDKLVYGEENGESEKFNTRQFMQTFKIPGVWIMAILMFGYVTTSAVASYLTPYSTGVLGISAVAAATIGTIRTYGCRFLGGPIGGWIADKVFHSVCKEQMLGHILCIIGIGVFLVIPGGTPTGIIAGLLILVGVFMFTVKGTTFSVQQELGIPLHVSGSAVAIATLIGYLPDMFVHTMFGNWLDRYGNDGYTRIFLYGIAITVVCVAVAFIGVKVSKRR
nr:MFS transporter [uncultured Blautia sp.]